MTKPALSLDHFGAMVRDLDTGAERWRKLGFRLAPRSPQMGTVPGDGAMEPWATANHCVVLRRGYLELIGIHDPNRHNPWQSRMDRFEGIHIAALRCEDADRAYATLSATVEGFDPPVDRRREASVGEDTRTMKFRNIFSRDEAWPEGRMIVIEHQTPEILWQESLMDHPNGAVGLDSLIFCVADPAPLSARLSALLGIDAEVTVSREFQFSLAGGGALTMMAEARFQTRFPDASLPPLPCIAGAVVSVADLSVARSLIDDNGVATTDEQDGFWVAPEDANGGLLLFVSAGGSKNGPCNRVPRRP